MKPTTYRLLFRLLLLGYVIYAALFIAGSSFVIDGQRIFALFDDAMISMRYARNLALGGGLVWNAGGERVEGFTNLLWTLYMALFHTLRIDASVISMCIQISGAIFLLINLIFVRRLTEALSGSARIPPLVAVLFTAFYLSLNNWGLQGMEVSVITLLITAAVWRAVRALNENENKNESENKNENEKAFTAAPYWLLGLGTLFRVDVAVAFVAIWSFMLWAQPAHRRRHLTHGLLMLALFIGGQTLFRLAYYGEIVPNTYHLKIAGYPTALRIGYGLYTLFTSLILPMNWLVFVFPLTLLVSYRDKPIKPILLLMWVFIGQIAYHVYVGGDAWEWWGGANRYVAVAMPLFFILLAVAGWRVVQLLTGLAVLSRPQKLFLRLLTTLVVAFALVNVNSPNPDSGFTTWTLTYPPLHHEYGVRYVRQARSITRITTPAARVAVVLAGTLPYFMDREVIDMLGKSDATISRIPMRTNLGFYPGHLKWDYRYSIGQLAPDVVAELWKFPEEAAPFLEADYTRIMLDGYEVWLRKGSPNVRWDMITGQ
jgi:arabinofuranosyltransferase